ncbi:MAG: hypothetical protein AB7V46_15650 [Thermomicrobiales bacterium]
MSALDQSGTYFVAAVNHDGELLAVLSAEAELPQARREFRARKRNFEGEGAGFGDEVAGIGLYEKSVTIEPGILIDGCGILEREASALQEQGADTVKPGTLAGSRAANGRHPGSAKGQR